LISNLKNQYEAAIKNFCMFNKYVATDFPENREKPKKLKLIMENWEKSGENIKSVKF